MEILKLTEEEAGARLDDVDSSKTRVLAQVLGFKFTYYQVRAFASVLRTRC